MDSSACTAITQSRRYMGNKKKKENKVQIAYRLPPELVRVIKSKAKSIDSTETYALETIIREWAGGNSNELETPLLSNADIIRIKRTALRLAGSADRLAWVIMHDVPTD